MRNPADGSRSDGFSTNVLPQASATGNIHIGTITGKLNGVMPAQTPTGWRTEKLSMPRPTCSVTSPRIRCGMPQANSTTSMPRVNSPVRVGQHLAVLVGDDAGERRLVAQQQLAELEHHAGAGQRRRRGPGRERGARGAHRLIDLGGARQRDAAGALAGRRVEHVAPAAACAADGLAVDEMLDVAHAATRRLNRFAAPS